MGKTPEIVKPQNPTPSGGIKWNQSDAEFSKEFFEKIPKAPGHYCRKDSSRYIPDNNSKNHDNVAPALQSSILRFYFHANNYSLFKRTKDNCNVCTAYEVGNVTKEIFGNHQKLKNDALKLQEIDKTTADRNSTFVITADTESLLTAPPDDANIMFFHSHVTFPVEPN